MIYECYTVLPCIIQLLTVEHCQILTMDRFLLLLQPTLALLTTPVTLDIIWLEWIREIVLQLEHGVMENQRVKVRNSFMNFQSKKEQYIILYIILCTIKCKKFNIVEVDPCNINIGGLQACPQFT